MSLSEEQKARIREIEIVRMEAREEARRRLDKQREQDFLDVITNGTLCGACPGCGRAMYTYWKHCPSCGQPAPSTCLWCRAHLPQERDLKFRPNCGKQAG